MTQRSQHYSSQSRTDKPWLNLQYHDLNRTSIKKPEELEKEMKEPPPTAPIDEKILDRIQGSMVGMALGDALGAHVEFRPRQYMIENPVTGLEGGGTWGLKKGQFTDDTSMALCLANSLVAQSKFNPYDQLVRYKWWYRNGYMSSTGECFDIGAATSQSIKEFERRQKSFAEQYDLPAEHIDYFSDEKLLDQFNVYCSESEVAGNGALMRLTPVPLFFYLSPQHAVEYSGRSGLITHGDTKVYDACRYYGALIVAAVRGYKKEELLDRQFYSKHKQWFSEKPLCSEIMLIAEGSYQKNGYDAGIRGKGYIVNALEAALWAFWSDGGSFEKGALAAVNLGDDTDTTAAIYGQLAGAYYGYKKLPHQWVKHVYAKEFMLNLSRWIVYEGEIWQPSESISPFIPTSSSQSRSHETITETFSSQPNSNMYPLQNETHIPVSTSLEYHGESQTGRIQKRPNLRSTTSGASQKYSLPIEPLINNRETLNYNHTDPHFISPSQSGGINMKSSLKNPNSKRTSSIIQTSTFSSLPRYDEPAPVENLLHGPMLRTTYSISSQKQSVGSSTHTKNQGPSTCDDKIPQSTSKSSSQVTNAKTLLAKTSSESYSSKNASSIPPSGSSEISSKTLPKSTSSRSKNKLSDALHTRQGSYSPSLLTQKTSNFVNGSHRSELPTSNNVNSKNNRDVVPFERSPPAPKLVYPYSSQPPDKEKPLNKANKNKLDAQSSTKITKTKSSHMGGRQDYNDID